MRIGQLVSHLENDVIGFIPHIIQKKKYHINQQFKLKKKAEFLYNLGERKLCICNYNTCAIKEIIDIFEYM